MVFRGKFTVGVVVACAAFGCAGHAQAGTQGPTESLGKSKGLEYFKAPYEQVVTQAGPHADCSGTDEVTGGGGSISGQASSAHLNATFPTDPDYNAWTTEATSHLNGGRTVTSYAICTSKDMFWQSSGPSQVNSGQVVGLGNPCPMDSQQGTGGGVKSTGGDIEILGTFPPGAVFDWSSYTYNTGAGTATVNLFAGCSADLDTKIVKSDAVKVAAGESAKVTVSCSKKQAVLGGGYDFSDQPGFERAGGNLNASIPVDSKKDKGRTPDDGWQIKAYNGALVKSAMTAYAVCLK